VADDGLILAYLRELHFSVARLPDADAIVEECEDHLLEVAERLTREGRSRTEAEAEAVARFGSAELVARVCVTESKRGVAVPTTRTRHAGLALALAPLALVLGAIGNVAVRRGNVHGLALSFEVAAFPLFVYGLWGLRTRHGGLGRIGRTAFVLAAASPVLAIPAAYGWAYLFALLLGISVIMFVVEMLRASVLPVMPLFLLAAGPLTYLLLSVGLAIAGHDAEQELFFAYSLSGVGMVWLGWYLWREPAADAPRRGASMAGA
jgi:hypothetical protein